MRFNHYYPSVGWLGVCLMGALLLTNCRSGTNEQQATSQKIAPPFQNVRVQPQTKIIDPTRAQVVHFAKGAQVEVPAHAFVDAQGKRIKTPIKLSLEVYDTPAKIMASGIPMTYQDGQTKRSFESAGMFQLTGTSQGQKIQIAKGKTLGVHCPSKVPGDDFDFFYFEEQTKIPEITTAQIGGKASKVPQRKGHWKKLTNHEGKATDAKPPKVPQAKGSFQLKFQENDIPEAMALNKVQWQLATHYRNPKADQHQWVLQEKWKNIAFSQPQKILGEAIGQTRRDQGQNRAGEYLYFERFANNTRVVSSYQNEVRILDAKGRLLKRIPSNNEYPGRNPPQILKVMDKEYLLVKTGVSTRCLYDRNGQKIGCFPFEKMGLTTNQYNLQKNRVVFVDVEQGEAKIKLADKSGKTIQSYDFFKVIQHKLTETHLLMLDSTSVRVFDLNGRAVSKKNGSFASMTYKGEQQLILRDREDRIILWDYGQKTTYRPRPGALKMSIVPVDTISMGRVIYGGGDLTKVMGQPLYWIRETGLRGMNKLWNYKTNTVTSLEFVQGFENQDASLGELPEIALVRKEGKLCMYDVVQAKVLYLLPGFRSIERTTSYEDRPFSVDLPSLLWQKLKKSQRLLVNGSKVMMFDFKGKVINDFTQYDSTTFCAGFLGEDKVYTLAKSGAYRQWDLQGNLLESKMLPEGGFSSAWQVKDKLYTYHRLFKNICEYNLSGDLITHYYREDYQYLAGDSVRLIHPNYEQGIFYPLRNRPKQVYQLSLFNNDKSFITYVYLDNKTKKRITKYQNRLLDSLRKEVKVEMRQRELIRSVQVENMGLYNWDRLIQNGSRIQFQADFDFGDAQVFKETKVFLIAQLNGNVVIPFDQNAWNTFSVDPTLTERLVAVLPEDKIAIFSQKQMKAINWQKVKTEGKHTFKMTILNSAITRLEELNKLLE